MNAIHKLQRVLLALAGAWMGAFSLVAILVPKTVAARALGVAATSTVSLFAQLGAGTRLGLALVATIASFVPRPPRPLVWAVALGLLSGVVGVEFNRALSIYSAVDVRPFATWLLIDGSFAVALAGSELARYILRKR